MHKESVKKQLCFTKSSVRNECDRFVSKILIAAILDWLKFYQAFMDERQFFSQN